MRRLSPAFLTIMMLGVVGLLVAMYFGKRLLATQPPPPSDPLINVPMALSDLKPGTRITEGHLGMGRAREANLERDSVRSNRVLVGRIVKNPITAAQPISTFDLYPPGEFPPLQVESGMRAVTIPLGSSTAILDGMVQPGQYVDIHFTPSSVPDQDENGGLILTLFKGIKILAMNGLSGGAAAARGSNSVTLELTSSQANIILLAKDRGVLNLTFTPEGKGSGVIAVDDENRATLYQILGFRHQPEPEPDPPFRTELYSGPGREVRSYRDGTLIDGLRADPGSSGRQSRSGSPAAVPDPESGRPSTDEAVPAPEERTDAAPPQASRRTAPANNVNAFHRQRN